MTILNIIEIICDFISAIIMVYFFNRAMPDKNKKYNKVYQIIMIIFYTAISSNKINNIMASIECNRILIFTISFYILMLIYPIFFKRGRISEKIFLSSFYITIIIITSFVVFIIFSNLFNITFTEMLLYVNYKRTMTRIIIRVVQFILIFIVVNNIKFIKYIENRTLCTGAIILILNQALILTTETRLIGSLNAINISIIFSISSLCAIQILSISMLNKISKEIEKKFILKMSLDRKIHDEEILDMYTEMIGWKHDFKNHITMISGLLEIGTKEDAISYINEINSSIRQLDKNLYTDSIAINSILISKIKVAEEKGIKISLDLKMNTDIKISNIDICVILGNLLDNAIEACSIINGYKYIELKIVSEFDKLIIKISNNTNSYLNEVNGKFLTTKNNRVHGIGLIQVDNTVKKYNGYINRKHENNVFTTYLMIQYKAFM